MTKQTDLVQPVFSLSAIRRFYFYAVALISMIAALFAIDGLLQVLSEIWLGSSGIYILDVGEYWRDAVARNGGVLLVAVPVFLLHWGYIQRRLDDPDERSAALRKLFLYSAAGVAIAFAATRGYQLLAGAGFLAFGGSSTLSKILPSEWLHLALMTAVGLLLNAYFQQVVQRDGDYGCEVTRAATMRRLFLTIVGLVGLGLVIVGSAQLLETTWQLLTGPRELTVGLYWWQFGLSAGLAKLLIGTVMLHRSWQRWHAIIEQNPAEASTALRRFYLYAAVVVSALAVLVPAAMLLRELLLMLFGNSDVSSANLLQRLGTPVSFMPAGIIGWLFYRRYLQQEAARYGESSEALVIRRIYTYAVAATALVLLWLGLVEVLSALLDALLSRGALQTTDGIWVQPLATGLSLIAIAGPVWTQHWRSAQAVAQQPDAAGHAERNSVPRKVYLYSVALVGAILILVNLALVLYRVLLLLLGEPGVEFMATETTRELASGLVAAVLWSAHVYAIRADSRHEAAYAALMPPLSPALPTVPSSAPTPQVERQQLEQRIAVLEAELAQARARLAELSASAAAPKAN